MEVNESINNTSFWQQILLSPSSPSLSVAHTHMNIPEYTLALSRTSYTHPERGHATGANFLNKVRTFTINVSPERENVLALISQNGLIHWLILASGAIHYSRPAKANFCLYRRTRMTNGLSERLQVKNLHHALSPAWVLLTLMMYNSLQLHLTLGLCSNEEGKKK